MTIAVAKLRFVRLVAFVLGSALLLTWVAFLNGAPLVFSDSITYVSTPWGWNVPEYFSIFYGAFIAPLHLCLTFWPVVFVQGAVLAHLLYLTLRTVTGGASGLAASAGVLFVLSACSALPWVSGQILPDAFTGVVVLGIFLLAFCSDGLRTGERYYVVVLTSAAIAFHLSHVPLAMGLVLASVIIRVVFQAAQPAKCSLLAAAAPVAFAVCALLGVNWVSTRQIGLARASDVFLLAKLLDEGPALAHLKEVCPAAGYRLCAYTKELEGLSNDTLKWSGESPLKKLGSADDLQPEARRIVRATILSYPGEVFQRALKDAARQTIAFQTGDGLLPDYAMMFAMHVRPLFGDTVADEVFRSRQMQGTLPIAEFRILHTFAAIMGAGLCVCFALGLLRGSPATLTMFSAYVLSSVFLGAMVTGALSGPHDRYLARVVWLLPFAALAGLIEAFRPARASANSSALDGRGA